MRPVWAVALVVLREVGRSLGFRVFVVALAAIAWFAPRVAATPDPLSAFRLAAGYGLVLPSHLIALATLVFATSTIAQELQRRTAQIARTRPLRAGAFIAGKVIGIVIIDVGLFAIVLAIFGIQFWSISSRGDAAPSVAGASNDAVVAASTSFTTPHIARPVIPPEVAEDAIEADVAARVAEVRERTGEDPSAVERRRIEQRARRRAATVRVPAGTSHRLAFDGVTSAAAHGARLVVRGVIRPFDVLELPLRLATPEGESHDVVFSQGARHEVALHAPAERGAWSLEVENRGRRGEWVIEPNGVVLECPYGRFVPNLARVVALLIAQFAFLASLGVAASVFLSLETASLVAFFIYFVGLTAGFASEALDDFGYEGAVGEAIVGLLRGVLELLPNFADENPLSLVVDGGALRPDALASGLGMAALRMGLAYTAATVCWARRELGGFAR